MSTLNQTWGVTGAIVQALVPQVTINDTDFPVSPTHFAALLNMASSTVNAPLVGIGFDLAAIAADATSVGYLRMQALTARLLGCYALRGSHAVETKFTEALCKGVMDELDAIKADPKSLGAGTDTPSRVWTTTEGLGLDTSESARASRRVFDDVRGRLTETDDPHHW